MPVMNAPRLDVPARWQRALTVLVAVALVVFIIDRTAAVVLPVLRALLDILTPAFVAFGLAYLLDPLVDRIEERGRTRNFGVAMVVGGGLLIATVLVLLIVPTVIDQIQNLGAKVAVLADRASERVRDVETLESVLGPEAEERVRELTERARDALTSVDWQAIALPVTRWIGSLAASGYHVAVGLLGLLLIPILTVYLLKDIDRLREWLVGLVPPRVREDLLSPLREVDAALSKFVRGQLMVAACLAALYSIGLVATGTPLGLTLGLFAGAVSFIPYLGLILGLVPALVLNFVEHGSLPLLLGVVATFAIAQFLEGNLITPKIVGESVGLHPVVVILAVIAGGTFFGLSGMLLALPVVAAGMVYVRQLEARYRRSAFFLSGASGDEPPAPDEPVS
jgi:predicted PurR-regulated permease PerM